MTEVLVVAAIVAVVAAVSFVAIAGTLRASAKRSVLKSDLRQMVSALNLYRSNNDDGLPPGWREIGYYGINVKDKFGKGAPPFDVKYDKPPKYDLSYHTRECAAPPDASPSLFAVMSMVRQYGERPRLNPQDFENGQAIRFEPACQPETKGKHALRLTATARRSCTKSRTSSPSASPCRAGLPTNGGPTGLTRWL